MRVLDRNEIEAFITKDGSEIREYYHSENVSLAEASLKPGQSAEYHLHQKAVEIYYILEGEGLMEIEGEDRMVTRDQTVLIPPGSKHRIKNIGDGQLRLLCFCHPPYSDDDTTLVEE
ncbi:MAG: cupin domain-containing protein [Archaeoglobaceae archaeon]